MRTLDASENVDQIDDFLTTIEMFFTIDDVGNVVPAKGLQIMLGLSQFPEQKRDMTRTHPLVWPCRHGSRWAGCNNRLIKRAMCSASTLVAAAESNSSSAFRRHQSEFNARDFETDTIDSG